MHPRLLALALMLAVTAFAHTATAQKGGQTAYESARALYFEQNPDMTRDKWPIEAIIKDDAEGLTVPVLEQWEKKACSSPAARLCMHHPKSLSQIEFIVSEINPEDSEMFLRNYLMELGKSGMKHIGQEKVNLGGHTFRRYRYGFSFGGVDLVVTSHYLVVGDKAWLVIGYTPAKAETSRALEIDFVLAQSEWAAPVTPR